jgi:predicted phage terminase large subunit-like protein
MVDLKNNPALREKLAQLSEQDQLSFFREAGRGDLFFLAEYILGYKGLNRELHGEMCDFIMSESKRKLLLIPRGHLKTTLGTVAYTIWRIINNPDIRILIANATENNATNILREIKGHFERNEKFRTLFPEIIPKDFRKAKWNEAEIIVNRNKNLKESTVTAIGVGGNLVSAHYDLIIGDDLVNDKNVATKEQIDKLSQWYSASLFLLEPGGIVNLIGTRWHFDDLYGRILENSQTPYVIYKKGIYKEDGSLIFPEKFDKKSIAELEKEITEQYGRSFFVSQYMNEVIDEETASFKRKFLKYYDELPKNYATSLVVDPAIAESKNADYTAFTVRAVDSQGKWFIVDVYRERGMKMHDLIERIFEYYKKWKLDGIGVETVAYQKAIKYELEFQMQKRNIYLPLYDLNTETRSSKEFRIKALVPRYEHGGIFFKKNDEHTEYLIDEMFRFPKNSHDDLLDSLAYHLQIPITTSAEARVEGKKVNRYGYPILNKKFTNPYAII